MAPFYWAILTLHHSPSRSALLSFPFFTTVNISHVFVFYHIRGNCVDPALSVLSFFYGANATTYTQACALLSDSAVSAVSGPLYAALATTAGAQNYGFFSGDDFTTRGYTSRTRSMLQVALTGVV